jgi:subtilase family serine protease
MLHNIGDRAVANPAVNFYLGDPLDGGILIESATVSLTVAGGMTTTLSIDWTVPEGGGPFTVYAVSDPDDVVVELDETNNAASVTVDAGSVYLPLIVR